MNLLDQLSGDPGAEEHARCSRKGCRADAAWQLLWNNPRIHPPERRKIWLACEDHRGWLQEYLQVRSLWKETLPLPGAPVSESDNA
ncbi:hypothetical protein [Arthrobacter caoxuetaonis]|uniref:Acetone carboxylase n=1 Tax=Arthrobacter caoxuetaonis TaxID=2886935 RepID=A0A9X1MGA9_9MICC|nr:hypothetical protein [Arthrobacter caoxuetaonis]MCC3298832.1 hypothetical protein [Arthrobacter caoxuetaonis]USQ55818.1 hypothetical protein NF551_08435 [Arthrobacter caoxuetaonis]